MFGGGPSAPKPRVQTAPPKEEDKAVQEAAADAARRRKLGRGFRSTILGGAMTSNQAPAAQENFGGPLYGKAPDVRMA